MAEDESAVAAPARAFVRVRSDDGTSRSARVELVDGDTVTAIPYVRRARFTLDVNEPNVAELELIVVDGDVTAEVVRLREIAVPPPREPKLVVYMLAPQRRWFGVRRSRIVVQQHTPAGNGTIIDTVAAGWTRARDAALIEATLPAEVLQ